jgi:hypothetical protein
MVGFFRTISSLLEGVVCNCHHGSCPTINDRNDLSPLPADELPTTLGGGKYTLPNILVERIIGHAMYR